MSKLVFYAGEREGVFFVFDSSCNPPVGLSSWPDMAAAGREAKILNGFASFRILGVELPVDNSTLESKSRSFLGRY